MIILLLKTNVLSLKYLINLALVVSLGYCPSQRLVFNNYHFEARSSARCHTQHGRHQGICRFQNLFIFSFTLFKKELNLTQYIIIYNTGENNPIKSAQVPLLVRN